jgi:hypothetical protein
MISLSRCRHPPGHLRRAPAGPERAGEETSGHRRRHSTGPPRIPPRANASCSRCTIRSGVCAHLFIAGPQPSPAEGGTYALGRARAPRVPLPRVTRGQQRSLTSPIAEYPQASIRAGQDLDRRPTFQAGHAASIPVARSTALPGKRCSPDRRKGRRHRSCAASSPLNVPIRPHRRGTVKQ